MSLRVEYLAHEFLPDLAMGILIKDRTGYDIYGTNTCYLGNLPPLGDKPGQRCAVEFAIPSLHLGAGSYSVTVALHSHADHLEDSYDWWDRALVFQVVTSHRQARFVGAVMLDVSAQLLDEQ